MLHDTATRPPAIGHLLDQHHREIEEACLAPDDESHRMRDYLAAG